MRPRPIILTGCPKTGYEEAEIGKRQWVATHFGTDVQVITCRSRDKALHMRQPGDVLIDDFIANVRRWQKAGGVAIYFRNAEQAIAEFAALCAARDDPFQIFADLDGTLADMDGFFFQHHGITPSALLKQYHGDDTELWRLVGLIPNFWARLPLMPGAHELWNVINDGTFKVAA